MLTERQHDITVDSYGPTINLNLQRFLIRNAEASKSAMRLCGPAMGGN
jgi:hypothetical protein